MTDVKSGMQQCVCSPKEHQISTENIDRRIYKKKNRLKKAHNWETDKKNLYSQRSVRIKMLWKNILV